MNGRPHTHMVDIKSKDEHYDVRHYRVTYGDTKVWVIKHFPFLKARLERAVKKAIRKHDKGSLKASQAAVTKESIAHKYNEAFIEQRAPKYYESHVMRKMWGSDFVKSRTGE